MAANKGKNNSNCFCCGESGHWVATCYLKEVPCVKGCSTKMKLFWSSKQGSYNCRFLKCPNLKCQAFKWVDNPSTFNCSEEEESSVSASSSYNRADMQGPSNNIKVTVEENGKKITLEGQVEVVIDVMKKQFNM